MRLALTNAGSADKVLPRFHSAKVPAKRLRQHCTDFPQWFNGDPEPFFTSKKIYRLWLAASQEESFEDVISHLYGHVHVQTVEQRNGVSFYPRHDHGEDAVTLMWTPLSAHGLLRSGMIQYLELDTSFHALRTYGCTLP
jgi:hypothetical protein